MNTKIFFALLSLCTLLCYTAQAQFSKPGELDTTFNFGRPHSFFTNPANPQPGEGANVTVSSLALQPDGKVLIGGAFTNYNGISRNGIALLNADGSLDASFNPGTGIGEYEHIASLVLQPDGKVLIGGDFTIYNSISRNGIARLNADGSLDASFNPGIGANNTIRSLALQPDGKVLIGGEFTSYNGTPRKRIARLNADGSLDATFNPGTGANSGIHSLALQPDGKVLIGGEFSSDNSTPRNRIARLNADGSLDASFNPGTGVDGIVWSLALQPDGKVLMGGEFTSFNGTSRNGLARLNANGSLDASFSPGTEANNGVRSFALQPDGKVLIGGAFNSYFGTTHNYIARLYTDGSLDASFNPGTGANSFVESLALQPDGKVLVGGFFSTYNSTSRNSIARLNADGSLDASFNSGTGANNLVNSLALQPDGRVLIAGFFSTYNDTSRSSIARLNADGSLDASFNPGTGVGGDPFPSVQSLALQPDGKVLIGGGFTSYNGTPRNRIARLNANGSLDTTFNPGTGVGGGFFPTVESLALQPDGKVLIGGNFSSYNGTFRNNIARLNADGSLDAGFNPGTGADNFVRSFALQPDGKVLIGGDFTSFNGTPINFIARLNADGSLDSGFNPGTGSNGTIQTFALQPDGKVLIGGWFTSYNGTPCSRIARLNADGSLDSGFNPGTGVDGTVWSLALQPDGKVLIGGWFTSYNGISRNGIASLNADGSLDAGFNPGTGANNSVWSLALQPDGKVLIGGRFTTYNGIYRSRIARVFSPVDCALVPKVNWTGAVSSDWHTAGNWSTGNVPTGAMHVIIGPAANICVIGAANAEAYIVQVRNGGRLEQRNGYKLTLLGTCTQLPPP